MRKLMLITILAFYVLGCEDRKPSEKVENNTVIITKEQYYKSEINKALLFPLNRERFRDNVLKNTQQLFNIDKKYKMINFVAEKTAKESDIQIFEISLQNFKKEYLKLRNHE